MAYRTMALYTVLPLHTVPISTTTSSSTVPPLSQYTPFCGNATGSAMRNTSSRGNASTIGSRSSHCSFSRGISSLRYPLSPTSRYIPLTIAPLAYAQNVPSHDTANAGPALACYVSPSGYHLFHRSSLFCGTAIGSAMSSMFSHVVTPLQLVHALAESRSLSRYLLSSLPPSQPLSCFNVQDVPSRNAASTCGTRSHVPIIMLLGAHLSHNTRLGGDTSISSAIRSMSSHVVMASTIGSRSRTCVLSRGIASLLYA